MRRFLDARRIDRLENLVILLLACLALFLIGKTGLFQVVADAGEEETGQTITLSQDTSLSQGSPVAFLVQNHNGRWGIQYDQTQVDQLYANGLEDLLLETLEAMDGVQTVDQDTWQKAITQGENWVLYDFLYPVSFTYPGGQGEARLFLVTTRSDRVDSLYFYDNNTGTYTGGRVKEASIALPASVTALTDNGASLAFEEESWSDLLSPNLILTQETPVCPVYTAENLLADLDTQEEEELLSALGFHLKSVSLYQSAEGPVYQEGSDTLRLQKDGTLLYRGAETGQGRYSALSTREKDLRLQAEELLNTVLEGRMDQGSLVCQGAEIQEDGTTALTFTYVLNGAQVYLDEEGWGARFVFRGSQVEEFEILLRRYSLTEDTCVIPPQRQAIAALSALDQGGTELLLCYQDNGDGTPITASWVVGTQE